ncbi:MAG: type II toxin-antitoxin system Phd/YefM family antitoxin [Bryobacteraceae bacterium]
MLYNLQDARSDLARLLDLAEGGEEVIIARDGRPVVRLERVKVPGRRDAWSRTWQRTHPAA